jgi:hypothetical protein
LRLVSVAPSATSLYNDYEDVPCVILVLPIAVLGRGAEHDINGALSEF